MDAIIAVAVAAGILAGAQAIGRLVPGATRASGILATGLGVGLLSHAWLGLGLIGAYRPGVAWTVWAGVTVLGCAVGVPASKRFWAEARAVVATASAYERTLIVLTVGLLGVLVGGSLVPPFSIDVLRHHLRVPGEAVAAGRLVFRPTFFDAQPMAGEMYYVWGLLLHGPLIGKVVLAGHGVVAVLAVAMLAARAGGREAACHAALVAAAATPLWNLGIEGKTDLALLMYTALALLAFDIWHTDGDDSALVLAAVFGGFAASTKLFGLVVAAALGALVLTISAVERRRLATLAAAMLVALAVGAPWYARTWAETGHPLWPFVVVEGTPDARGIVDDLTRRFHGHRAAAGNFALRVAAAVAGHPDVHGRAPVGPLFLATVPLLLLVPGVRRVAPWAAWSGLYAVTWYVIAAYARYLLPAFIVWSAVTGWALAAARGLGPLTRRAVALVALTWAITSLAAGLGQLARMAPVVTGTRSLDAFLERVTSHHADIAWMNRHLPRTAVVASVYPGLAYLERRAIWLEDLQAFVDVEGAPSLHALRASLARWGVTHLFLVEDEGVPAPPVSRRRLAELAARCGTVVYDNPGSVAVTSVFLEERERLRTRVVELRDPCT